MISCISWNEDGWSRFKKLPVLQLTGADSELLTYIQGAHAELERAGCKATLQVLPKQDEKLRGLRGGDLLAAIGKVHRAPAE